MKENNQLQEVRIAIHTRNTSIEQLEGRRLYHDIQVLKEKYERMGYKIQGIYSEVGCYGLERRFEQSITSGFSIGMDLVSNYRHLI